MYDVIEGRLPHKTLGSRYVSRWVTFFSSDVRQLQIKVHEKGLMSLLQVGRDQTDFMQTVLERSF